MGVDQKTRVIVLGSNGMLGQMVVRYFSRHYEVVTPKQRFNFTTACPAIQEVIDCGPGVIMNCVGLTGQKSKNMKDLLDVNSKLPRQLIDQILPTQFLIHPSTDGVFSGSATRLYQVSDVADATDDYGKSKKLGEEALLGKKNGAVVRVSIIGPNQSNNNNKGLMQWLLDQPRNAAVNGFTNQLWNGITTFEWCRQIERHLFGTKFNTWAGRILQLGSNETYSKYQLLNTIRDVYETGHQIRPTASPLALRRCLEPHFVSAGIADQLFEMKEFCNLKAGTIGSRKE